MAPQRTARTFALTLAMAACAVLPGACSLVEPEPLDPPVVNLVSLEPEAMGKALAEAEAKVSHQVERLGQRGAQLAERRSAEAVAQARRLAAALTPGGEPQERVLSPFHFLARYPREEVVDALEQAIDPADPGREIVLDLGRQPAPASC